MRTLYEEQFKCLGKSIDVGSILPSNNPLNPYIVLGFEEDEKFNMFMIVVFKQDFELEVFREDILLRILISDMYEKKSELGRIGVDEIYIWTNGKVFKSKKEFEIENSKYVLKAHRLIQKAKVRNCIFVLYVLCVITMLVHGVRLLYSKTVILISIVFLTVLFMYLLFKPTYYLSDIKK